MGFFNNVGATIDFKELLWNDSVKLIKAARMDRDFKYFQQQIDIEVYDNQCALINDILIKWDRSYSEESISFYEVRDYRNSSNKRECGVWLFKVVAKHEKTYVNGESNEYIKYKIEVSDYMKNEYAIDSLDDDYLGKIHDVVCKSSPENVSKTKLYKKILACRDEKRSRFVNKFTVKTEDDNKSFGSRLRKMFNSDSE